MISQGCEQWATDIESDGCALVPSLLSLIEAAEAARSVSRALAASETNAPIRSQEGTLYAARNVLEVWPDAATIWRRQPLLDILSQVLGQRCGLVRVLYFDKPPGNTWALGWHKDLTIAVKDNRLPSARFRKPTFKAGVPHVEAPEDVLRGMLTARIHLDEVTEENGPLKIIPGSHVSGRRLELGSVSPRTILTGAGDVFLMRPMLAHSSGRSHPNTQRHRRILHLEFAADPQLSDGYAWYTFLAVQEDI